MIKKLRSSCSYALAALVILMLLPGIGRGQILTFEFSALTGSEVSAISNSNDANLTSSSITRGVGLTASANAQRFNATSWALTSIANAVSGDDYMEFTIAPNSGYQFDVSSIVVQWQRSGTGNSAISLRSSVDSYATDLDGVKSVVDGTTTQTFTWTFNQANSSTAVTYRLYSYAEATAGSGGPGDGVGNDIVVYGTTSATGGNPIAATPTFNPTSGTYFSAQNVTLACATSGSSIYYTTDGTDPDNSGNGTLYSLAIPVSATTTIKARAYAIGYDQSAIGSATYTFPTEVDDIAALRAASTSGLYKLTGEAILTLKSVMRNAKYIQDASGAVLIDDPTGIITTVYNLGDGITGIIGTTAVFNNMLQFTPVTDPGAATSNGNTVTPVVVTLTDMINHPAQLVTTDNLLISDIVAGTGSFVTSKSYNLNGNTNPVLRTQYSDLDYISTVIPTSTQNITGVVLQYTTTTQLVPRSLADFENYVPSTPTITVNTATLSGFTYVQGSGPSAEQTFTVEGVNLTNDISIAASTNYEISKTTGTGFTSPLVFTPAEAATPQTVYVRLKAGLAVADYSSEVINITSSPADAKTVTCSGSVTSTPLVSVTFQVNMANETVSANGVHIAGNFNGWEPAATLMSNGGSGDLFSVTLQLNSTNEYQFKYINGNAWGSEELVPATCQAPSTTNRFVVIGNADYSIDPVCFSSCENCPLEYTFQVNMQNETVSADGVYLAGDFTGWASGAILMTANGNVWSATVPLQGSSYHEYKFVNGNPNSGGQWELFNGTCVIADGGNRFYTTPTANTTLDLVCFNSCAACPVADFVMINEVDADQTSTDTQEFIELYDGGIGNTNLTGLVVVLYNGNGDVSYAAYDLDGFSTDANGYFIIGNSGVPGVGLTFADNFLQNGADAVSLYAGDATSFPNGTLVTTTNLVDAMVYDTDDADDPGLLVLLNAGQPQINENGHANGATQSMQRIPNGSGGQRNTSAYDETDPTPGTENFIPIVEPTTSIWNGSTSSDWFEVSNWTNDPVNANVPPVGTTDVSIPVVATNYPTITDFAECNNITIASGASLIDGDNFLSVSGTATVNRTIADASDDNWHLFISPIEESTQASAGSCFEGAYVDGYNEETGAWDRLVTDADVTSDQGYSINYLSGSRDLVFTGTLLSSPVSFTDLTYTPSSVVDDNYGAGWHLVGNPYPCGINPALFSLPTNMNAFAYVWNGGNYVTPSIGTADVPGTIASLQGFFVRTTDASNDLTLDNAAKVHGGAFYKSSNSASQMLSLSIDGNNYSDKTYVRFNPEATANFDQAFDAYKRAGIEAAPQLYSIVPDEKAAVNTLPDYIANPNISLGLKVGASTSYTINVSGIESFDASTPIRLDDLKLGTSQDLRLNPVYSFSAAPGDAENRFLLRFASVTAVNDQNASGIKVVAEKGIIRVTHNAPATGTVYLYSVSGQLLATSTLNKGGTTLRTASTGVYLVKVVTGKTSLTRKMVVLQ